MRLKLGKWIGRLLLIPLFFLGAPIVACKDSNGDGETGAAISCASDAACPERLSCCNGVCCLDFDNDGYEANVDCDDTNPNTFLGAPERCDGEDNSCNGLADDGLGDSCCGYSGPKTRACTDPALGECARGIQRCDLDQHTWGECSILPTEEVLNGKDDDCDGPVDEGFVTTSCDASAPCLTLCGSTGHLDCTTSPPACVPPTEVCNGLDDDCDGKADNFPGAECVNGDVGVEVLECGSRTPKYCSESCVWVVTRREICDGQDNDCANGIDVAPDLKCSLADRPISCTGTLNGHEFVGTRRCADCQVFTECRPGPEVCDGADNDGDGQIDEGFSCPDGDTRACVYADNTPGTQKCISCQWAGCSRGAN